MNTFNKWIMLIIFCLGALFFLFKAFIRYEVRDNDSGTMFVLTAIMSLIIGIVIFTNKKNK